MWDNLVFNANNGGPNLPYVAAFYLHPHQDAARAKQALFDVALPSPFGSLKKMSSINSQHRK
jgi:hypothetical protein